ncbi:LOW QUALITY PROTEIN: hypothetical protein SETIT_3G395800v2 [Setaria italica]|uniref:DUF1618 domain-containing protein n=1 Tax=Setaria italica TaxID=4555 RepID=A0A368QP20_SETIT|nr:LOW QUALITY PROTEIN: hypothetical protein SETIT_3G395800v2 [Setaria italica]
MNLPTPSSRRQTRRSSHRKAASAASGQGAARRLPRPVICFEPPRGYPMYIFAVGTRIVATYPRDPFFDDSGPDDFLPIVDVRWRGVTFGPGRICQDIPIYLPVGNAMFALDTCNFKKLSFEPLWPPRLENRPSRDVGWSWCDLPRPPFDRVDVTSYVVHGQSIVFSVESDAEPTLDPDGKTVVFSTETFPATFTFDTAALRRGEWMLPFTGRAFFVHGLQAFVGLSKDTAATFGHLCCCKVGAATNPPAWKLGKEKLFSDDPAETHVGATLIYMGRSAFCLLQCVSIEHGNAADQKQQKGELEEEGGEVPRRCCYLYRVTTFSLSFDDNGDLRTGGTCQVQCYNVPEETTERFLGKDPVALWL